MQKSNAPSQYGERPNLTAELATELSACTPASQAEAKARLTRAVDAVADAIERACEISRPQKEETCAAAPANSLASRLSRAEAATRTQASPDKGAVSHDLAR